MSRSDRFVDEEATTLTFVVPTGPDRSEQTRSSRDGDRRSSDVISADEAAAILGVSRWSLYAAANRQEVPHRRLGRRMLFSRRAVLLWLEGASPRGVGKE